MVSHHLRFISCNLFIFSQRSNHNCGKIRRLGNHPHPFGLQPLGALSRRNKRDGLAMSTNNDTGADADAKRCVPCAGLDDSAVLSEDEVKSTLEGMPLWDLIHKPNEADAPTVPALQRRFVAKNFQCALDAINGMGAIAEEENHHPDFHLVDYRTVIVELYTHKLNGITENDIVLARMLDRRVPITYSPKWLREHPEAAAERAVVDE